MTDFDPEAFLEWLDDIDSYYVESRRVHEEWPGFYENYSLGGVTMIMGDDGEPLVPVRDYEHTVTYGHPLD